MERHSDYVTVLRLRTERGKKSCIMLTAVVNAILHKDTQSNQCMMHIQAHVPERLQQDNRELLL